MPTSPISDRTRTTPISSEWSERSRRCTPENEAPKAPSIVAIGGGTGLSVLLRGLKPFVESGEVGQLTAIVAVTDDGGSSGRLRRDFGVLPPGDIRNCLVALADDEDLLSRLFQYRFPNGGGLTNHSFGNLFLTALTGITGDFYQAILTAEQVLNVRGKILPATLTDLQLHARGSSGKLYEGESAIGKSGEWKESVVLDPPNPPAFPPAVQAILEADLVLLGPGSLYTSILPNLLIGGIRRGVAQSPAPVGLLMNLMTEPGETDGMDGMAHLNALRRQAHEPLVDVALVNSTPLPPDLVRNYADIGSEPITVDRAAFEAAGVQVVATDLLDDGQLIRHDPAKLGRAALGLMQRERVRRAG